MLESRSEKVLTLVGVTIWGSMSRAPTTRGRRGLGKPTMLWQFFSFFTKK